MKDLKALKDLKEYKEYKEFGEPIDQRVLVKSQYTENQADRHEGG